MSIDHSLTYQKLRFKNIPHQLRLKSILNTIKKVVKNKNSYVDIGCSNGYITKIVSDRFSIELTKGLDHETDNLKRAKETYPDIEFAFVDLNKINESSIKYDLVTCFETIEHVGNIENALTSLVNLIEPKEGVAVISVPIEIGIWGIIKYILKVVVYRYSLSELAGSPSKLEYLKKLLRKGDISQFRDNRPGWGTHFGFDYRKIDGFLKKEKVNFKARSKFTTRFYIIENSVTS